MSDESPTTQSLRAELDGLETALSEQISWIKDWHLRVVGKSNDEMAGESASGNTPMDQWLKHGAKLYEGNPIFEALGMALNTMQNQAIQLAEVSRADGEFPLVEYESFMNAVMAFNELAFKLQRESWAQVSNVDQLTGVGNDNAMRKQLVVERERARRADQPLAVIFIAMLEHSSTTGPEISESEAINRFIKNLAENVRPYDQIYRADTGNFVVCLPNTDIEQACLAVDRLQARIKAEETELQNGSAVKFDARFGIAPVDYDDNAEDIMNKAAKALAAAVDDPRKNFAVWSPAS